MTHRAPRGTTAECLADFFKQHPEKEARDKLADFVGVQELAVRRWQTGGNVPKGDSLLKTRVFLDLIGYKVKEFEELPGLTREFTKLIAFGLITEEGARDLLEYKNIQDVFRVVLKGDGLYPQRQHRLTRFVENSTEELERYLADWRGRLSDLHVDFVPESPDGTSDELSDDELLQDEQHNDTAEAPSVVAFGNTSPVVYSLAQLLQAATPLVEFLDDSGDSSWRQTLRLLVGDRAIKTLATQLEQPLE